ncbi:hypothetical protein QZH41_006796 [Actinostola sp. cb2023]|nr:hypothetical protein QZH41_006796 [Actinostola sp. cb2023]
MLRLEISASSQSAHQADGSSPMRVIGETRFELIRNHHKFLFEGLVVENLDVEVLAGTPFMECNDIAIRPAKREITLKDGTTVLYGSSNNTPIDKPVCRALVLRAPGTPTTIWPGEYLELQLPDDAAPDAEYTLGPRLDSPCARATTAYEPWSQPNIISSTAGKTRLPNLSGHPQTLKRNEHFSQVSPVFEPNKDEGSPTITPKTSPASLHTSVGNHSDKVQLDPDNLLSHDIKSGTLQACPHRIAALSTCSPPSCVTGMRSFIGDYKVLAGVIPRCASVLAPLEDAIAGRQSSDPVKWTDELSKDFTTAQTVLSSNRTITLPKPNDQLWIVTDGAVGKPGIGATLYITREGKLILAGFFSAKLRDRQVSWLPCEVEALAIAVAIKHFSPYIIQSRHKVSILTDSKPCVQAFEKLCRGEFSVSPRVSTFLSTVSRYQATVQHVAGAAILPSDLASRDAPDCNDMSCQVCSFIKQTEDSVIGHLSVEDVLKGTSKLPFTSRAAWQSIQAECADLRRTHAHLTQGIRPSKKLTNIKDIKRYSSIATIASDGLLIVQGNEPLSPPRQRIVVPRQVLEGLLTALHIKLEHPSRHQLRSAANRYFFALDMDKAIDHVTKSCHPCAALKKTRGLSAREVWMQRDQFSNHQVPLSDQELVHKQHDLRNANHPYSEKSKAPLKKAIDAPQVKIGDLVYLYSDRNTSCSRDRYLVTSTEGVWCNIRKFTGPQHRKTPYRVKASECYKVPNHMSLNRLSYRTPQHDSSDARPSPPEPPEIRRGISTPPTPHSYIPTDNFHELVTTPPATVDNEDHLNTITDNQSPRSRTYLDNQAPRKEVHKFISL